MTGPSGPIKKYGRPSVHIPGLKLEQTCRVGWAGPLHATVHDTRAHMDMDMCMCACHGHAENKRKRNTSTRSCTRCNCKVMLAKLRSTQCLSHRTQSDQFSPGTQGRPTGHFAHAHESHKLGDAPRARRRDHRSPRQGR